MSIPSVPGFEETGFSHGDATRTVYRRGQGPGVLLMHEIPGITPPVAECARRIADDGFTVLMPHLFGETGKPASAPRVMGQIARACISREFHVLASRASSPITEWLRALAHSLHQELGGRGIGVVGMCITGNFALILMVEPWLRASVVCQPSLPFPVTLGRRAALHLSEEDLAAVAERSRAGCPVLGLRFTHDALCPGERFQRLRDELGSGFDGMEIDSGPGNEHEIARTAHSVLTEDFVDEQGHPTRVAMQRVLAFLHQHLDADRPERAGPDARE